MDAFFRQARGSAQRVIHSTTHCHHHANRFVLQPAQDELKHAGRGTVDPLHIIDGDQDGS
jgi:hypothetical protein